MGVHEDRKFVAEFDKDGDKRLNTAERKAAREFLAKEKASGGGRERGPRRFGREENFEPAKPGARVSAADVKTYPGVALYASNVLRTLFFEFENSDWEKELSDFHGSDVEVPATLTIDGVAYHDVGVHFRGNTSYMMVAEGRKRSLNVSVDFAHDKQNVGGYRTLNLLNSHEDPTFLRSVLFLETSRAYIPAPKANLVRVVINGEDWGVYANIEQFNKDFLKESFGSTKGARWKIPGSPGGGGSLAYLGDDVAPYRRLYEIKSKDDALHWSALINLCKVLNLTPTNGLEAALSPILDIDGVLRFLALDNALINNDGYWTRGSDYSLYRDENGRFHVVPHDTNETFSKPGGPGFGGGGPGGPGGFLSGMLANEILSGADKNNDAAASGAELKALANDWFTRLDTNKAGKLSAEEFANRLALILSPPPGFGPPDQSGPGRNQGGRRGPGGMSVPFAGGLFTALDADKDASLTSKDIAFTFAKWSSDWDTNKTGSLDDEKLRRGLSILLAAQNGGDQRRQGGRGQGGPGGGGMRVNGVELDPLISINDTNKPLISKLLAVPTLKKRYLEYVKTIAENDLNWQTLGPRVQKYHDLISEYVKADTRKLASYEAFESGIFDTSTNGGSRGNISLKAFADQRRAYLLGFQEKQALPLTSTR
jgi:hypothetical protein